MSEQEVKIAKLEAELIAIRLQFSELMKRFIHHMDKEEEAFGKLYNRMRSLEKELVVSFKERDRVISSIRIEQTKMMAWMTAAFAVVTILTDFAMRVLN